MRAEAAGRSARDSPPPLSTGCRRRGHPQQLALLVVGDHEPRAILRLDDVVSGERFSAGSVQPRWLHVDDAVAAVCRAVTVEQVSKNGARWATFHIVRGDAGSRFPAGNAADEPFGFRAQHVVNEQAAADTSAPAFPDPISPLTDLPVPGRVVMFGAG